MSILNTSVEFKNLKVDLKSNVAHVTIDIPPANALNSATIEELTECVKGIEEDNNVKAAVITGQGKFFVAGADIKEFQQAFDNENKGVEMAQNAHRLFNMIENSDKLIVAAINGACLGGGLELAMSCHLRIASDDAVLGQPELNLGLIPGYGGTQRLTRITNQAKALEIILLGKNIKGEEAETIGLVNKSVPSEQTFSQAVQWAEIVANKKSSISVSAALNAVTKGIQLSLQDGLTYESELFGQMFKTEDMKEGVTAFIEKREPEFRNK